jgi:hypothetical protein
VKRIIDFKKMKVLSAGIDTLVVGFKIERYLEGVTFDILTDAKSQAAEKYFDSKGCAVNWYGVDFIVQPRGSMGYEWVLQNDDITMCLNPKVSNGRIMPEVYVTFSSKYLWAVGYKNAFYEVYNWILTWAICNDNTISRCDLCMDIEMPMPVIEIEKEMVTKARYKKEYPYTIPDVVSHYSGRRITSYQIGKGKLLARIYDKTNEIIKSRKDWFKDIWEKQGWDKNEKVVRVEFQCRREFLKEKCTQSFADLEYTLGSIWDYCTHDWLRVCDAGSKGNQSRWKEKEYWKLIQDSSSMFGEVYSIPRVKIKKVKCEHLMKQLEGILISLCALMADEFGIDGAKVLTIADIRQLIHSKEFKIDVMKRMAKFGNVKKVNNNYLIEEIMKLGGVIESIEDNPLRAEADKHSLN